MMLLTGSKNEATLRFYENANYKALTEYNSKKEVTFDDILDFHVRFEIIHPFQGGNGRVGRFIMFMECLTAQDVMKGRL